MTKWLPWIVLVLLSVPVYAQNVDTTTTATYVLEEGDTLFELAARLGISPDTLAQLNQSSRSFFVAGDEYQIPKEKMSTTYTVKNGDTLFELSRRFGVSVTEIQAANRMNDSGLQIGATLTIPGQGVREKLIPEELGQNAVAEMLAAQIPCVFNGRLMANGQLYDSDRYIISHPNFPPGTVVWLTNPATGQETFAEVADTALSESPLLVDISGAIARVLMLEANKPAKIQIRLIHGAD